MHSPEGFGSSSSGLSAWQHVKAIEKSMVFLLLSCNLPDLTLSKCNMRFHNMVLKTVFGDRFDCSWVLCIWYLWEQYRGYQACEGYKLAVHVQWSMLRVARRFHWIVLLCWRATGESKPFCHCIYDFERPCSITILFEFMSRKFLVVVQSCEKCMGTRGNPQFQGRWTKFYCCILYCRSSKIPCKCDAQFEFGSLRGLLGCNPHLNFPAEHAQLRSRQICTIITEWVVWVWEPHT